MPPKRADLKRALAELDNILMESPVHKKKSKTDLNKSKAAGPA
jgi:hypothetical protein